MKKALITGITGQDGSYLAEYLLTKNYEVSGLVRRVSTDNTQNIKHLTYSGQISLYNCDMTSSSNVFSVISDIKPDEVYNLAAQSDVRVSFDMPDYTMAVNAVGVTNILEALRKLHQDSYIPRFYQASTSELFGKVQEVPQREATPFYPRSPYGVSKLAAHWMTINYREAYGMFNCTGILFNHESPRRGLNFVTRKVVNGLKQIKDGKIGFIELGNLDSQRDWGHAKDYVRAMHMMMQYDYPDDYVVATGEMHSIRELVELAGKFYGFDIVWKGLGLYETGIDKNTGKVIVKINPKFYRPAEVDTLQGNPEKIKLMLNWQREYTFETLIQDMCENES